MGLDIYPLMDINAIWVLTHHHYFVTGLVLFSTGTHGRGWVQILCMTMRHKTLQWLPRMRAPVPAIMLPWGLSQLTPHHTPNHSNTLTDLCLSAISELSEGRKTPTTNDHPYTYSLVELTNNFTGKIRCIQCEVPDSHWAIQCLRVLGLQHNQISVMLVRSCRQTSQLCSHDLSFPLHTGQRWTG